MDTAYVIALGQRYDIWQTIEVSRAYYPPISYAMMTVAEMSTGGTWQTLKLKLGDPAQVYLNGQLVLDGHVFLRQAAYDPESHAVQIGIFSWAQNVIPSTTDANPGQYKNQTLQQIGSAVFGKVGVNFQVVGNPPGADKPFPRVSEIVGESRFDFINRLAGMRNVYLIDDGQKTILATRGPQGSGPVALLTEGQNILKARLLLKNSEYNEHAQVVGQNFNNNAASQNTNVSANGTVPGTPMGRSATCVAEEPCDQADAQMRLGTEISWYAYATIDGTITIPGWQLSGGSLWITQVGQTITINSPMLIPEGTMAVIIKGVSHRQNDQEGTVTDINVCGTNAFGLGTGEAVPADAPG